MKASNEKEKAPPGVTTGMVGVFTFVFGFGIAALTWSGDAHRMGQADNDLAAEIEQANRNAEIDYRVREVLIEEELIEMPDYSISPFGVYNNNFDGTWTLSGGENSRIDFSKPALSDDEIDRLAQALVDSILELRELDNWRMGFGIPRSETDDGEGCTYYPGDGTVECEDD